MIYLSTYLKWLKRQRATNLRCSRKCFSVPPHLNSSTESCILWNLLNDPLCCDALVNFCAISKNVFISGTWREEIVGPLKSMCMIEFGDV